MAQETREEKLARMARLKADAEAAYDKMYDPLSPPVPPLTLNEFIS